jgi:hypothetical protein
LSELGVVVVAQAQLLTLWEVLEVVAVAVMAEDLPPLELLEQSTPVAAVVAVALVRVR